MTGVGTMQAGEFVLQYPVVYCDRQCTVFSHCLDTVHKHCSQKKIEKNNKVK